MPNEFGLFSGQGDRSGDVEGEHMVMEFIIQIVKKTIPRKVQQHIVVEFDMVIGARHEIYRRIDVDPVFVHAATKPLSANGAPTGYDCWSSVVLLS